ncbi:MAG: sugar phosphate isomerase/epimerase [Oscillospiraceae bacterium]|jgi:sugar phosphate isomerase/epimerase|nr:sugar phosphate isomerase/epimerase [Oscillospiraceae bacterium]
MAVKLSGFADEIDGIFENQLKGLKENGIDYIEVRGVNNKSIHSQTKEELGEAIKLLDKYSIKVSAIGSPVGKIKITDDFEEHQSVFDSVVDAALSMGTKYIRIFSFFIPDGQYAKYRGEVMRRLEILLDKATKKNLVLCHENERDIYGESPELCLDIMQNFGGAMRFVFDPANFVVGGFETYPDAYNSLSEYIEYMHIKDADETGIFPAGFGKGKIKEILSDLINQKKFEGFLTVEPHLSVFSGIDELEGEGKKNTLVKNKYRSKAEAFSAAANALKNILNDIYGGG